MKTLMRLTGLCLALFGPNLLPAAGATQIELVLPAAVNTALLSPANDTIALGLQDGGIFLIDAGTGAVRHQWNASGGFRVEQLAFSADGRRLLAVFPGQGIRVLATDDSYAELARWDLRNYIPGADITPDGTHVLAVTAHEPLRWYEVSSGRVLKEWSNPDQPQGYQYVKLLNDHGLAVVSAWRGATTLVEAELGKVAAVLTVASGLDRPIQVAGDEVVVQTDLGTDIWSRASLLQAAASSDPKMRVVGRQVFRGGLIGLAATGADRLDQRVFWNKEATSQTLHWIEPIWDRLPSRSGMRPMIVDRVRHRLWCCSGNTQWLGQAFGDLGFPDGLRVPGYSRDLELIGPNLVGLHYEPLSLLVFDWREMVPVFMEDYSQGLGERTNGLARTVLLGSHYSSSGYQGGWMATADPHGLGWSLAWQDAKGARGPALTSGLRQVPKVKYSAEGLAAVYSTSPGQKVLGPVPAGEESAELLGLRGTVISVPAVQLWDPQTGQPLLAAFNDHRDVGVLDVHWAPNGRWLATHDYDGSGQASTLRVFSVPAGRRLGLPHRIAHPADFAVSDDGTLVWSDADGVISMCSPDGSVRVLLAAQPLTRSARLALSPSGRELALLCAHNEVLLFSLAEAKISRRWTLPSDSAQVGPDIVGGLIFVEANTLVVLGDNGSTVRRFKW